MPYWNVEGRPVHIAQGPYPHEVIPEGVKIEIDLSVYYGVYPFNDLHPTWEVPYNHKGWGKHIGQKLHKTVIRYDEDSVMDFCEQLKEHAGAFYEGQSKYFVVTWNKEMCMQASRTGAATYTKIAGHYTESKPRQHKTKMGFVRYVFRHMRSQLLYLRP